MRTRWIVCVVVVVGLIGFVAGTGFSEDPLPDEAAMKKMMEELSTPGAAHEQLATMAGEWDVESKMWMAPGEPTVTKATSSNRMILGGRYLQTHYKGTFMGGPFEGTGIMGFDNYKKVFESTWISTMGTALYPQAGKGAEDGKSMTLHGVYDGPMGKMPTRMTYTLIDADTYKMENWTTYQGQDIKEMELLFTRKKAQAGAKRGPCCPPSAKGPGY